MSESGGRVHYASQINELSVIAFCPSSITLQLKQGVGISSL